MKPILLVPMAGLGKRFSDKGFALPKPLIMVDGKSILDYSFESINPYEYEKIIFVIRREQVNNFQLDEILKRKYINAQVVIIENLTEGSTATCLCAKDLINNDNPLAIYCLDVSFAPVFTFPKMDNCDGYVLSFQANNSNYSYAEIDKDNNVQHIEEKKIISSNAMVGIYCFSSGKLFVKYAEEMINKKIKTNNEYYLAPIYNLLIQDGLKIKCQSVDKMYVLGTPEELDFYRKHVSNTKIEKPIALCSDHSGYELKEKFKEVLSELNIKYIDFGTYTNNNCDYPDFVSQAANHIKLGFCNFGIGFCRSGQGINISANKIKGIRCAWIMSPIMAQYAIKHNCANFFAISSALVETKDTIRDIVKSIMSNTFDGGRHSDRISKLEKYENN